MSLEDPLGLEAEKQRNMSLAALMIEWNPQGQTEVMLVISLHHFLVTHNATGAKTSLSSLIRLQHLRRAKTPAELHQAVEFFNK
jgi:hypothetical protein